MGIGFFIDIPIADKSFTLRPEINYSSFNFSTDNQISFLQTNISKIKLHCNISSIKLSISFQYTHYSKDFRPFVNLGVVVSHNLKNECKYNSDVGVTNPIELDIIRKSQMGVIGSLGLEFPIFKTKELFIQNRFTALLGDKGVSFLKKRYIEFSLGIKL